MEKSGHDHSHGHSHDHEGRGHADHNFESDARGGAGIASTAEVNLAETEANQRKLKRATMFVLVFFVIEVIGGLWSGSLAIISDAAHLLADISGFILAMIANEIATRPACDKFTYGPVRAEVLSALFSTVTILVLSLLLVYSAIYRLVQFSRGGGEEINGRMMSFIALLGLAVNLALLGIFGHDHAGHDHSHGHSHGHDESHDHSHGDSHGAGVGQHDEEEALVQRRRAGGGGGPARVAGERAPLVNNASVNSTAAVAPVASGSSYVEVSGGEGSVNSAKGGQDRYGSLESVGAGGGGGGGSEEGGAVLVVGEGAYGGKLKKEKNINMEAAVLHAVTDLVQSAGVLLAGLLIWYDPRWKWADPIATLFFVGLVVNSTRWLLKRAFNVLLEGVPDSIDYDHLRSRLSEIDGVTDLHCLHVWSLTLGRTVVSAHIKATEPERVLASAHEICEDMGVAHSTIQVQMDHCVPASCTHPCVSAVGKCCGPEGMSSPRSLVSDSAPSREAS